MTKEVNNEAADYVLARMIFMQNQIASFAHRGWDEFKEEAESLEQKIHTLWIESGREEATTADLMLWAQGQGISF